MKALIAAVLGLGAVPALAQSVVLIGDSEPAPDPPVARSECRCRPREVGESGSRNDWDGYGRSIRWHYSVDEARAIARDEGKLVFYYLLAGDLDKEGC